MLSFGFFNSCSPHVFLADQNKYVLHIYLLLFDYLISLLNSNGFSLRVTHTNAKLVQFINSAVGSSWTFLVIFAVLLKNLWISFQTFWLCSELIRLTCSSIICFNGEPYLGVIVSKSEALRGKKEKKKTFFFSFLVFSVQKKFGWARAKLWSN